MRRPNLLHHLADRLPFLRRMLPKSVQAEIIVIPGTVRCLHCGREMKAYWTRAQDRAATVSLYSMGCLCRLSNHTLEGLLDREPEALRAYKAFWRSWYVHFGHSEETADKALLLMTDIPAQAKKDIAVILQFRALEQSRVNALVDKHVERLLSGGQGR